MVRSDWLCLQGDDDGLRDENKHEQRAKLFEWVFRISYNLPSRLFSPSTLGLVRDTGKYYVIASASRATRNLKTISRLRLGDAIRFVATSRMRPGCD